MRRTIFFLCVRFLFDGDKSKIDRSSIISLLFVANSGRTTLLYLRKFLLHVDHYAVLGSDYLLNVNVPPPSCPATGSDPCN